MTSPTAPTADISIEDVLADPQVGREMPKAVFFAVRMIHGNNCGEGATRYEVAQAMAERNVEITDEEIARCFILLRYKGMLEEHGTTEYGGLIVRPAEKAPSRR